jgi:hypothetical protein
LTYRVYVLQILNHGQIGAILCPFHIYVMGYHLYMVTTLHLQSTGQDLVVHRQ